jgi:hypothetical protein
VSYGSSGLNAKIFFPKPIRSGLMSQHKPKGYD